MHMANSPGNHDIEMRRSTPRRDNSMMGPQEVETPDIWRIHWSWKQGTTSSSEVGIYSTREVFERELFRLVLEQEANTHGQPRSLRFSRWVKMLRKRNGEETPMRKVERIVRVEHLERGQWVLYSFGVIAPSVVYARQEN